MVTEGGLGAFSATRSFVFIPCSQGGGRHTSYIQELVLSSPTGGALAVSPAYRSYSAASAEKRQTWREASPQNHHRYLVTEHSVRYAVRRRPPVVSASCRGAEGPLRTAAELLRATAQRPVPPSSHRREEKPRNLATPSELAGNWATVGRPNAGAGGL